MLEREVEARGPHVAHVDDAMAVEPERVHQEGSRRRGIVGHDDALAVEIEIRTGDHGEAWPRKDVREWRDMGGDR